MKFSIFFYIIYCFLTINIYGGIEHNYFYYYGEKKIYLKIVQNDYALQFDNNFSEIQKNLFIKEYDLISKNIIGNFDNEYRIIGLKNSKQLSILENRPEIKHITPVLEFESSAKCIIPNRFVIKYKSNISQTIIDSLHKMFDITIINIDKDIPNTFIVKVNKYISKNNVSALNMANIFHNLPQVIYAAPDFLGWGHFLNSVTPNDTYFGNQWHLAKVQAPYAWAIKKGRAENVVAVLDNGFDLEHEDLINKYYRINNEIVGADFTSQGDNSPSPSINNAHGTACAGLVAAETNNNMGVAGYDWYAKIMPLQVSYNGTDLDSWIWDDYWSPFWTRDAISFAKNNGADIISMSFTQPESNYITSAIQSAANEGRAGKGCIIIASSGNDGSNVNYPANLDEYVIAVGATDENDEIWSYSNYGSQLDVVAPSGLNAIMVQGDPLFCEMEPPKVYYYVLMQGNIWTTDLSGSGDSGDYGYYDDNCYYRSGSSPGGSNDGKYTALFSGTSAAAPQVAGLASLILSINQELTRQEVQTIIQESADEVSGMGNESWTQYYGHGRINAYKALKYTIENYETVNVVSGTISTPTNWSGFKYVTGDVTVNSGVTLTITAGSIILFDNGKKITVNGTLSANGNLSNTITFTTIKGNPSAGDWGGIKIFGDGSLDYCNIEYANYGVYVNQSTPIIQNCNISNCTSPLYIYKSNSVSGQPSILNNTITGNGSGDGIYLYESSPDIFGNDISSFTNGIYCKDGSSPDLGSGGNNFMNNYRGLKAYIDCYPYLSSGSSGTHNEFTSNHTYYIWAKLDCEIDAENNWWGTAPPSSSKFYESQGSDIDYTPWLTSGSLNKMDKNGYDNSISLNVNESPSDDNPASLKEKTDRAVEMYFSGDYDASRTNCMEIISVYPDSNQSLRALNLLWNIAIRKNNYSLSDFKSYLLEITKSNEKKTLYGYAKVILAGFEGDEGLSVLDGVVSDYADSYIGEAALIKKTMYYFHEKKNIELANGALEEIKRMYPESEFIADAAALLEGSADYSIKKETAAKSITPAKYEISGAYPNPFNPATTISYALPRQSQVSVQIYNIRGQKVKEFTLSSQNAGNHQLTWNGQNRYGGKAASGLYIIRFHAEALEGKAEIFQKSIKVIMLK